MITIALVFGLSYKRYTGTMQAEPAHFTICFRLVCFKKMLTLLCFLRSNFIILPNIWNNMWGKRYFRSIVVELTLSIGFDVETYIFNDDLSELGTNHINMRFRCNSNHLNYSSPVTETQGDVVWCRVETGSTEPHKLLPKTMPLSRVSHVVFVDLSRTKSPIFFLLLNHISCIIWLFMKQ